VEPLFHGEGVSEPESFAEQWFNRVWNEGDAAAIDELLAPEGLLHGLGPNPIVGPEEFRTFHSAFLAAFREVRVEVLQQLAQGDRTAALCRCRATHRASGRVAVFQGAVIFRVSQGKLVEGWNTWDFVGLLEGMGVLPLDSVALALRGELDQRHRGASD